MKKLKKTSVSLAWLARARPAAAPAPARAAGDRLDLLLPRGWPDSGSPVFWRWQRRGDTVQSGQVGDLRQLPEAARGVRWDDPAFGVGWPAAEERLISERDRSWPDHAG